MASASSLQARLSAALPQGVDVVAYHISTPPTSASALFAPVPGQSEETTHCESHFLAISSPQRDDVKEVIVFAIEILIFTTQSLTTLFVSKADSAGFSSRLNAPRQSPSVVAAITATFIEYLLGPRLSTTRVILSLFARSQNQYLFPGSIENAGKHVLDDCQLIKWWCRVTDRVLRLYSDKTDPPFRSTAHLVVPGCDKAETRAFFPASSRQDLPSDPVWINSYPVELLVADTSRPPRHLVPRLPDDPKSRFLDDLDGDFMDNGGRWRSVKNLDQFWEMMSYRQECSAGRLVGFLWLVFSQGQTSHASLADLDQASYMGNTVAALAQESLPTPGNSPLGEDGDLPVQPQPLSELEMIGELTSPPSSSPLERVHEELRNGSAEESTARASSILAGAATNREPSQELSQQYQETQGELVLDAAQYQTLMNHLLQTDFAGEELAAANTKSWIQKALELSSIPRFGIPIRGRYVVAESGGLEKSALPQVNVLTGIRKKRKAEAVDDGTAALDTTPNPSAPAVNTLAAGLLRKKPRS
ncbi:histone acetylation protein-domain-containing protein [Exophiala viscosa]|uniref:histone acetyltransferase n=1 Tax=Exophiala viscosa TaxID=2486360 RepID=A0AAN6IET1_9EURO|nr:histone acetylation protein-domain-containing protein [Exophiala viscosa]